MPVRVFPQVFSIFNISVSKLVPSYNSEAPLSQYPTPLPLRHNRQKAGALNLIFYTHFFFSFLK